jgi:hypothetical protein
MTVSLEYLSIALNLGSAIQVMLSPKPNTKTLSRFGALQFDMYASALLGDHYPNFRALLEHRDRIMQAHFVVPLEL